MSDEMRRSLARRAVELGDVDAAKSLVRLLERSTLARDWPLSPDQTVWHLQDEDFGRKGRRVHILNVLRRSHFLLDHAPRENGEPWHEYADARLRTITLREIASLTVEHFTRLPDCGPITLASLDAVLARAGLHFNFKNDPTLSVPMASPPSLSPQREANASP